jgi:hypothetical protein
MVDIEKNPDDWHSGFDQRQFEMLGTLLRKYQPDSTAYKNFEQQDPTNQDLKPAKHSSNELDVDFSGILGKFMGKIGPKSNQKPRQVLRRKFHTTGELSGLPLTQRGALYDDSLLAPRPGTMANGKDERFLMGNIGYDKAHKFSASSKPDIHKKSNRKHEFVSRYHQQ